MTETPLSTLQNYPIILMHGKYNKLDFKIVFELTGLIKFSFFYDKTIKFTFNCNFGFYDLNVILI